METKQPPQQMAPLIQGKSSLAITYIVAAEPEKRPDLLCCFRSLFLGLCLCLPLEDMFQVVLVMMGIGHSETENCNQQDNTLHECWC